MSASPEEIAPSDEQLAQVIARRGESETAMQAAKDSFEELHRRHASKLLSFLRSRVHENDFDDVAQGVWERVWEHLAQKFHGGNFRAWLHQIARNYLIDQSRKKPMDRLDPDEDISAQHHGQPDELLIEREREQILRRCMEQLSGQQRAVFQARSSGEGYDEISHRLEITKEKAYKILFQATEQLRKCVERAMA